MEPFDNPIVESKNRGISQNVRPVPSATPHPRWTRGEFPTQRPVSSCLGGKVMALSAVGRVRGETP